MARRITLAFYLGLAVMAVALLAVQTGLWVDVVGTGEYDRTTVTAIDDNGSELATVDVRIADTTRKRYVGLSETESLARDEGMLFVYDEPGSHAFVMREMDFPLDIVFLAENGRVTEIHHASTPPDGRSEGELTRYRGNGTYVLEVRRGWANRTGVDEGDRVYAPNLSIGWPDRCNRWASVSTADGETHRRPLVTAIDANGSTLDAVSVRVADNQTERYTGLSDTESMGWSQGMLFVYDEPGRHTFVMREMDFPLDIVFVAANGTVTRIHQADTPPASGYERRYPGEGQYVLEVNRGWTEEAGLDVGDRICAPVIDTTGAG